MSDLLTLFGRALDEFDRRVSHVAVDQWSSRTPCTDWDVRTLVDHLTTEQLWVPHVLDGRTAEEVGDQFEGDVLGDDSLGAWRRAAARSRAAAEAPGALERTVYLS